MPPIANTILRILEHCRNEFHKDLKVAGLMIFYSICIYLPCLVSVKGKWWWGMKAREHKRILGVDLPTCPQYFCQRGCS